MSCLEFHLLQENWKILLRSDIVELQEIGILFKEFFAMLVILNTSHSLFKSLDLFQFLFCPFGALGGAQHFEH